MKETPLQVLERLYAKVERAQNMPLVADAALLKRIEYVARCLMNRAGVRLLMACRLGKIDRPHVDPREPYTEIEGSLSFSGRTYDEQYIPVHQQQQTSLQSYNRLFDPRSAKH